MAQRIKRDADEIRRLYVEDRLSMKAIARQMGCGDNTIKRDLLSMGVRIRGKWEQRKIDEAEGRVVTQSEHIKRRHVDGRYANAMTPERRKRISEFASQRTGEKNPFFGKKHSIETKRVLSEHALRRWSESNGAISKLPLFADAIREERRTRSSLPRKPIDRSGPRNSFYGRKHSLETRLKISAARGGDGKSFIPKRGYPVEWTVELRASIRDREGYRCLMCGKPQGKRKLSVHHVDYDRWNNSEKNLAALCIACHCKTNVRRKAWIAFFGAFGLGPGGDASP